jgi:hypothetical protein
MLSYAGKIFRFVSKRLLLLAFEPEKKTALKIPVQRKKNQMEDSG